MHQCGTLWAYSIWMDRGPERAWGKGVGRLEEVEKNRGMVVKGLERDQLRVGGGYGRGQGWWQPLKNTPVVNTKKPPFWRKMYQNTPRLKCTKKTPEMYQKTPHGGGVLVHFGGFFWYLAGGISVFGGFFSTFRGGLHFGGVYGTFSGGLWYN